MIGDCQTYQAIIGGLIGLAGGSVLVIGLDWWHWKRGH